MDAEQELTRSVLGLEHFLWQLFLHRQLLTAGRRRVSRSEENLGRRRRSGSAGNGSSGSCGCDSGELRCLGHRSSLLLRSHAKPQCSIIPTIAPVSPWRRRGKALVHWASSTSVLSAPQHCDPAEIAWQHEIAWQPRLLLTVNG